MADSQPNSAKRYWLIELGAARVDHPDIGGGFTLLPASTCIMRCAAPPAVCNELIEVGTLRLGSVARQRRYHKRKGSPPRSAEL